jgi:hypothetical protein
MPLYLVEVSEAQAVAFKKINHSVSTLGSHFATHADWRHQDGISTGTMVVDAFDRWGALGIVPPALRGNARVFPLGAAAAVTQFTNTAAQAVAA